MGADDKRNGGGRRVAGRIGKELRRSLRLYRKRPPPARPRIPLGRDPIEVHSLVCASHVRMSLWSLKSFIAFTGLLPRIVIHDDGSLTEEHRRLYAEHFDGITVLEDGAMTERMEHHLAAWPACLQARRTPGYWCTRKLMDILFAAESDAVIYVDADILFFREPKHLLEHARSATPCFSADYQNAYAVPPEELEAWLGKPVAERVNSGLLCLPIAAYRERLDLIERYLQFRHAHARPMVVHVDEQTAHAVVMSDLGAARLPPTYALSGDIDENTVSFHFVNDGRQRKRFMRVGVPRIKRAMAARLREIVQRA